MEKIIIPPVMYSTKNKERIIISAFNGRMSLSLFGPTKGERPVFSKNLALVDQLRFKRCVDSMVEMPPSNQKSLTVSEFIDDKYKPTASICFGKDDNANCYIEFQFQHNGTPRTVRFDTFAGGSLQPSEAEFNRATATMEGVAALQWWMDNVLPTALILTGAPFKPKASGGSSY